MKVAIIGSGISGCAAAWHASDFAEVTVFESEDRLGGHTHTQEVCVEGVRFPVDTGFIVFNHRTYPGLKAWFEMLGVETAKSDMSFSASLDQGRLEWCGTDLNSVFAQRNNLVSPKFWWMLADIVRFNRQAPQHAAEYRKLAGGGPSLGEYLDRQRYSTLFLNAYLLPMAGAIWSCPTEQMRAFPMATFTQFCENHGLLTVSNRPQWYTVQNGAKTYIEKLQSKLQGLGRKVSWRTGHEIRQVLPEKNRIGASVEINGVFKSSAGPEPFSEAFDAVIVACHSDQAAKILPQGGSLRQAASKVRYQKNTAILHTDASLMPKRKSAWASWNYLHDQGHEGSSVSVTYWMNRLQPLPVKTPVLVSLNPIREPSPESVINTMEYMHPIFDGPAIRAQKNVPASQGEHSIWLAGAWLRYGFHEDGYQSAVQAVASLKSAFESGHDKQYPRAA
jgi:uncharacterized protein